MQFLDMSPLQAALPKAELSSPFLSGATQSWFPQNPVSPFVQAAQGKCSVTVAMENLTVTFRIVFA